MKLTFLGTGTSTGVPQIGCRCETCTSADPCDHRMRTSALVETEGTRLLIDCGPDLWQQMIAAGSPALNACLVTHTHYDHVGGIDDLRPYCAHGRHFPIYCRSDVERDLRARVPYCFAKNPYPGVPTFAITTIVPEVPFEVDGVKVTPLPVIHYKLPIVGFKIGRLAYITDCKTMPDNTLKLLQDIDTLVINALRHNEHMSHLNLEQAIAIAQQTSARRTFFTHISHDMGPHASVAPTLPDGMQLAYDGLTIEIPD